jgi:hypothetical protein
MGRTSRAVCISRDEGVRRVVGDALRGAGVGVEFVDAIADVAGEPALIVVDRETRRAAGDALHDATVPVVVVGDRLDDDGLITLMLDSQVSHVIGEPAGPDLGVTGEKIVSGELFGLEKYVAAGTVVGQREIASDPEKRSALGALCAWAESVGARKPVVHRVHSVVDELLMNALHDAPAVRESGRRLGTAPPPTRSRRAATQPGVRPAVLRWAADGTTLAISVGDAFGELRQRDVIDNVRRARSEGGRPQTNAPGAGLGLYLVLANVAGLIINVDPGHRTEVVCLFDLGKTASARSLHVFAPAS